MDFKALSFDRISLTYLSGPGRVFHDEIRVGTSYNAVTSHRLPWGMTASWANLDVIPSAVYLSMKEGNWNTAAACLKRRVPMHPDLSPFQESANLLENVTASILQSFHSDIGNTIEICLRNKARPQLRVAAVNAGHILCVHEREDRDVLHQLRPEDLHITEQLKRLGGPRSMTAHLYHATLLLHNGNMRAAALSFSRMNTPLGNGLAQLATAEYDAALVASLIRTLAQHGFLNNAHTEATARSVLERETFSRAQRANLQAVVVRFQQQHPDAPQRTKALLTEVKRSIEL